MRVGWKQPRSMAGHLFARGRKRSASGAAHRVHKDQEPCTLCRLLSAAVVDLNERFFSALSSRKETNKKWDCPYPWPECQ